MKILQLPQGYYGDLTGTPALEAIAMFVIKDLTAKGKPWLMWQHWQEIEVKDTETAPWGYEWYTTDDDGKLRLHSANIDSSG